MKLIVSKEIHIVKVIFSDDLEIKKNQEIAEYLNIHEAIKNIVNGGNPDSNNARKVNWESCEIIYEPLLETSIHKDAMLGQIKILDADVLYESFSRNDGKKGMWSSLLGDKGRYTKQFRMGKWVDRLLKYSEKISIQYQEELKN
jgi:hypothetical protein